MKTYARIDEGVVVELIPPMAYDVDSPDGFEPTYKAGDDVPIEQRYNAQFIDGTLSTMIDTAGNDNVEAGWTYDGTTFAAPVPYQPTKDEILAANTATRDTLLGQASTAIAPLQMAVSLGEATDAETSSARAWVAYSRSVKAVDLTQASPTWPVAPPQ
jgi:hypothetical protein